MERYMYEYLDSYLAQLQILLEGLKTENDFALAVFVVLYFTLFNALHSQQKGLKVEPIVLFIVLPDKS